MLGYVICSAPLSACSSWGARAVYVRRGPWHRATPGVAAASALWFARWSAWGVCWERSSEELQLIMNFPNCPTVYCSSSIRAHIYICMALLLPIVRNNSIQVPRTNSSWFWPPAIQYKICLLCIVAPSSHEKFFLANIDCNHLIQKNDTLFIIISKFLWI
jgi:hypothetical protein